MFFFSLAQMVFLFKFCRCPSELSVQSQANKGNYKTRLNIIT